MIVINTNLFELFDKIFPTHLNYPVPIVITKLLGTTMCLCLDLKWSEVWSRIGISVDPFYTFKALATKEPLFMIIRS